MTEHTLGSGNIFTDLGFPAAEAEQLAVKSGLVRQVGVIMEQRGLSQTEAAALIGTDQPTLSKVLRGRLGSVSVERVTAWLNTLGCDVTVTVSPRPAGTGDRGHFSLSVAAE